MNFPQLSPWDGDDCSLWITFELSLVICIWIKLEDNILGEITRQKQLPVFSLISEILKVVLRNSREWNDHQDWQLGGMHPYENSGRRMQTYRCTGSSVHEVICTAW